MRVFVRPAPQVGAERLRRDAVTVVDDAGSTTDLWIPAAAATLEAVAAHERTGRTVWAVCGTVAEVLVASRTGAALWLRGSEAGGALGGAVPVLILLRAAVPTGARFVAEGLGVRGMAAAMTLGAAGIVLDAHLWLCSDVPFPPELRAVVRQCSSGLDTVVSGELDDTRVRTLARPLPRPLGVPQTLGGAATNDGRTMSEAVATIVAEVQARVAAVRACHALDAGRDPLGTGIPIVQGPMANVSERTGLARAVRAAGGMPFAAMGALDRAQARDVLARFAAEVPPPWGVGIIGFDVMAHRDAHLQEIQRLGTSGPAAIILAGGSPALARDLGPTAWLHCPSARLVGQAFDAGVRGIVLEGHEAGGHVGRLTSVGLWEEGLAVVEQVGGAPLVVLAGGIGDAVSAAFAAAMAAVATAGGARIALQAGTAFFFTHEIVEHGQLTPTAQELALACTRTVLVGSSVNLPLRCAPNAYSDEARALERTFEEEGVPRPERRARIEHLNLGRTRLAAKGILRSPDYVPGDPQERRYVAVESARQLTEGAFTLGEGAVVEKSLDTVAGLLGRLTVGARVLLGAQGSPQARWRPVTSVSGTAERAPRAPVAAVRSGTDDGRIAVVGLGCVLPGAADVPSFWRNLVEGRDAIEAIPETRWSSALYFDPDAAEGGPARSYARHAGVVRFRFDPVPFRIPPRMVPTLDASQQLALLAAREAVASAGWGGDRLDRHRAAVVLGNSMGGEHAKSLALRVRFREVLALVREDEVGRGWSAAAFRALESRLEDALDDRLPPVDADSMAGLLANVVAGRVASWLDWMGGNLTVDAACASSLASIMVAVDWLRSGRCDAVLAGGVDADLSPESYVGFCRTEALSRTGSSPFSTEADGFVMGEGAAVFALKRLRDAERDGDPIRAVLRGVGQASDGRGRGITAPRAEGQQLAIRRALEDAGVTASEVGVVEAHGTGTSLGDRTETDVLARTFAGVGGPVWVGSVKSGIGHLKGAAGAAGLLKLVLSLETGIVPATLRAGPVHDGGLRGGPLRLPRAPVALAAGLNGAVSAFGFGGTNFHVVVSPPERRTAEGDALRAIALPLVLGPEEAAWAADAFTPLLLAFGAPDPAALLEQVAADAPRSVEAAASSPVRLLLLVDPARRREGVQGAVAWLSARNAGQTRPARDLFYGEGPPCAPVWAFPGQGSQRSGAVDAASRVPATARALHRLESLVTAATGTASSLRDWEARAAETDGDPLAVHVTLFALGVAWAAALREMGVPCGAAIGHSLGGFAAAEAVGALSVEAAVVAVVARGRALAACPPGAMLAVRLGPPEAEAVAAAHGLWVAAVNTAGRSVLAGDTSAVEAAAAALGPTASRRLAVARPYHTPMVLPAVDAVQRALAGVAVSPPRAPLWSAASGAVVDDVAEDLARAIASPVRFDLAAAGLRPHGLLIELGPGTTLCRFAEEAGLEAGSLDPRDMSGPARVAAMLAAAGHPQLARSLPATLLDHALPAPDGATSAGTAATRRPREVGVRRGRRAEPVAAQVASVAGDEDPVRASVRAAICEVTGYPPALVEDGADLEADLGVDSIRKMEILGLLEKRLGFVTAESDYAALSQADLAALVAHVRRKLAGDGPRPPDAVRPPTGPGVVVAVERRDHPGAPREADLVVPPDSDPRRLLGDLVHLARTRPPGPLHVHLPDDAGGEVAGAFLRSLQRERGQPFTATGLLHRPVVTALSRTRPLAPRPVVVATGSAGGILGPCLGALADLAPTVVLLSRRPSQVDVDALRSEGLQVTAHSCDLTDGPAVAAVVREVIAEHGRIDLVLHAAGALSDTPAPELDAADLDRVWGPKWLGANHLIDATRDLDLVAFVTFSSLVARVGNAGQTAYAAANAAMTTLVHPRARTLHLAWTAWSGVGMASHPTLQEVLTARGVIPIAPEDGGRALRGVLEATVEGTVWIAAQVPPGATRPAWPLGEVRAWTVAETRFSVPLDPDSQVLADHQVAGRALVPAAVWLTAILAAARVHWGAGGTFSVEAFDIVAPTFVDRPRDDVELVLRPEAARCVAEIRAGGTVVATASVGRCASPALAAPPMPLLDAEAGAGLYRPDLLFHGPAWRVLERMRTDGNGGAEADVTHGSVDGVAAALDGAHQLLAAWSGRSVGWMGLPVGADRWVLGPEVDGPLRLETRAETVGREMRADVTARDASGQVILQGTGVRLRAASAVEAP